MSHMGLADLIEAVVLYQLDNPAETGFHVGRQDIELFSNPVVQQFYDPRHLRVLLHFCNGCRQPVLVIRTLDGAPVGSPSHPCGEPPGGNSVTGNETTKLRGFRSQPPNCGAVLAPVVGSHGRTIALSRIRAGRRGQRCQTCSCDYAILRRVIRIVSTRSIRAISPRSERVPKVEAVPLAPARPVRPTRWMKSSGTCGRS